MYIFFFKSRNYIVIELPWPEYPANTCARHAEPLDSCFDNGNSIYNIIPLIKKENVHLFLWPRGYNNYADAFFQSSLEAVALDVTVSSEKSMDITNKTHSD